MPRGLTVDDKAKLAARVKAPAYFVEIVLASATLRAWTGYGTVNTLGGDFLGVGELGFIRGIESDRTLKAQSITLGLSGIPGDSLPAGIIAETRGERYQGRPMSIYLGFLNPDTGALLATPTAVWTGFADVMTFALGSEISVSLTGEHFGSHMRRTNGLRMSTESHNQRIGNPDPKDLFFEPQSRLMGRPQPLLS